MKPKTLSSLAVVIPTLSLSKPVLSVKLPKFIKESVRNGYAAFMMQWQLPRLETTVLQLILENMLLMASHLQHANLMLAGMLARVFHADFEILNASETTLPHVTFRGTLIVFKNIAWYRQEFARRSLKHLSSSLQMLEVTLHSLPTDMGLKSKCSRKEATDMQMFAHDVRRPFSLMKATLEILRVMPDASLRAGLEHYEVDIQSSMDSVNSMLAEILRTGSKGKPVLTPIRLETIISESVKEVLSENPVNEVTFHYDFDALSRVEVDHYQVGRVVSNIISNALEAMHNRGSILISASEKADMMEISIVNTGSSIEKDALPKIFDTYFTSGKKNGTGLGLAIAKKVVESHGGEIGCRSEVDGTEFFFTLPLAK